MSRKPEQKTRQKVEVTLLCIYGNENKGAVISVDADEAERLVSLGAAKAE